MVQQKFYALEVCMVHCTVIEYENKNAKPAYYLVQLVDLDDPNGQWQEWFLEPQEVVTDPALAKAIGLYNICSQMWALIELGRPLINYGNATFIYHDNLSKYIMVEGPTSKDVFDYVFGVRDGKFLLEKGKKYLQELFKKWDPKHLWLHEEFDDYLDNDGLENIIGDEGTQNLNVDD